MNSRVIDAAPPAPESNPLDVVRGPGTRYGAGHDVWFSVHWNQENTTWQTAGFINR